mmetsp:Transcript_88603/g.264260  ORF Transcript_88603/g.264260 Transcript_88603/m.264260 type:complete len:168 (-) Transcript_88603:331-834(-)
MDPAAHGPVGQVGLPQPPAPAVQGRATAPLLISSGLGSAVQVCPEQIKFHMTCRHGDLQALQGWLGCDRRARVDLDWRDSVGMTALMWTALDGHIEVARALLEAGADPTITDDSNPDEPVAALDYALGVGLPAGSEDETDDEEEGRGPQPEVAELIRSFVARNEQDN